MCVFYQAGRCFKNDNCDFAHNRDELCKAPKCGARPASSGARGAPPDRRLPAELTEEDGEVLRCCVKNTFLSVEVAKERDGMRRTLSCPAFSDSYADDESDEPSPRDTEGSRGWAPAPPPPALPEPADAAAQLLPTPTLVRTPPMSVTEAYFSVPGMTTIPDPMKMLATQVTVPVCALQRDRRLVEVPAMQPIDYIILASQLGR